jgi:hypothetical protein
METEQEKKHLDDVLEDLKSDDIAEYEEVIELWITYGGD